MLFDTYAWVLGPQNGTYSEFTKNGEYFSQKRKEIDKTLKTRTKHCTQTIVVQWKKE